MTSPSTLLSGETLSWVTYDPTRTVSAGLRRMLRDALEPYEVQLQITEATSAEVAGSLVEQQGAGLMTLVLTARDWAGGCRALRRVQVRRSRCLRCVYLSAGAGEPDERPELAQISESVAQWTGVEQPPPDRLLLWEAGAQIVLDQIPCYQRLMASIVARAPRKAGGTHPITRGLMERLPWPNFKENGA